jgi:hypothetical protein
MLMPFSSAFADILNDGFDPGKLSFTLKVKDMEINYATMSLSLLPNEKVQFEIITKDTLNHFQVEFENKPLTQNQSHKWDLTAPVQHGLHKLSIICPETGEEMLMNIFVLIPYSELKGEYLNGYRIGKYPTKIFKALPVYKPPRGFIEVTETIMDIYLSPHFQLRQFICKQESGFPKYVIIKALLLLKLELILETVNAKGYPAQTFNILSGFRTPYYNKAIGNVKYSRHQWGDAADFFIDENPMDDMMDDLNGDGKNNWKDAAIIYDIIDDLYGKGIYDKFIGGLARYKKSYEHGPFVHTDVRGYRARWGY